MIKFEKSFLTIDKKTFKFDFPIEKVLEFKLTHLVLFNPDSKFCDFGQFPNLIGLDYDQGIVWTAELPTTDTGDCYHNLDIVDQKIIAYSWRSYQCIIDDLNGKIIKKTFTK